KQRNPVQLVSSALFDFSLFFVFSVSSVSLWFNSCLPLCPLCLCGESSGCAGGARAAEDDSDAIQANGLKPVGLFRAAERFARWSVLGNDRGAARPGFAAGGCAVPATFRGFDSSRRRPSEAVYTGGTAHDSIPHGVRGPGGRPRSAPGLYQLRLELRGRRP